MEPHHHTLIVSTVGTSVFTNLLPADDDGTLQEARRLLNRVANASESEIRADPHDWVAVEARVRVANTTLQAAGEAAAADQSAELNGIAKLGAIGPDFSHVLLHTDTCLGGQAAETVREWLSARNCREVRCVCLERMTTRDVEAFQYGVDFLMHWCDDTLPAYRRSRYRIVFNLVGGFKSLQAYAQTIGMIYADAIVYTFEAKGSGLITIPRLPLALHTRSFTDYPEIAVRFAAGELFRREDLPTGAGLADAYLRVVSVDGDEYVELSQWGRLAWNTAKREVLKGELLAFPGVEQLDSFRRDYDGLPDPDFRVDAQETLARVSWLWREGGLKALRGDGGLQYEDYAHRGGIGHFRLNQGNRVSCSPKDGKLLLRHIGAHDVVNRNP